MNPNTIRLPHSVITAADPQPDENGGCAKCHGPRPKPVQSRHNGEHPLQENAPSKRTIPNHEALAAALADPFCSAACCRAWYEVQGIEPMPLGRAPGVTRYKGSRRHLR